MKHAQGRHVGGRHTTIIDAAVPIRDFSKEDPDVKEFTPGDFNNRLPPISRQRLTIKIGNGCLDVDVRGSASVQTVRLYTERPFVVKKRLVKAMGRNFDIVDKTRPK